MRPYPLEIPNGLQDAICGDRKENKQRRPVVDHVRIERGEITGRVKDAAVAGNAYELLKRIGGFGNDARWAGTRFAPSLLLEG